MSLESKSGLRLLRNSASKACWRARWMTRWTTNSPKSCCCSYCNLIQYIAAEQRRRAALFSSWCSTHTSPNIILQSLLRVKSCGVLNCGRKKGKKRPSSFLNFRGTLNCNTGHSSVKLRNLNVLFGDHISAVIVPISLRAPRKFNIYGIRGRRHNGHTSIIKAADSSDRIS